MIAFMNVVYNITSRNAGTSATESRVWHCVENIWLSFCKKVTQVFT